MTKLSAVRRLAEPELPREIVQGSKDVFCNPGMPSDWRPRPSTIVSDFGWIVGRPRRSLTPSRPASTFSRVSTGPFARMQAADSPPVGMP